MPFTVPPVVPQGAMRDAGQPEIPVGPDMVARPLRDDDATWLQTAFEDPAIQMWHSRRLNRDEPITWIRESAERWTREEGGNWAIVDTEDQPLGRLGLHQVELSFGTAEISYWILPHTRRRGVAAQAVNALSVWAFNDLGLHRLTIHHSEANEPSCRVAESAGYEFEGIMRSALRHRDGWHDMHIHGRIASDG